MLNMNEPTRDEGIVGGSCIMSIFKKEAISY